MKKSKWNNPKGLLFQVKKRKFVGLSRKEKGLKQASMQWHEKFDSVMMTNGFKINECDKCVYVKNTERGFVIICLYVDDILIMGSNNEVIKTTKEMFNNKFDMKDLGVADVILGIKISKTLDGLILSQSHYIEKILKKFKQNDSSPMRTPIDVNLHLSKKKWQKPFTTRICTSNWHPDVCHKLYPSRHSLRY